MILLFPCMCPLRLSAFVAIIINYKWYYYVFVERVTWERVGQYCCRPRILPRTRRTPPPKIVWNLPTFCHTRIICLNKRRFWRVSFLYLLCIYDTRTLLYLFNSQKYYVIRISSCRKSSAVSVYINTVIVVRTNNCTTKRLKYLVSIWWKCYFNNSSTDKNMWK